MDEESGDNIIVQTFRDQKEIEQEKNLREIVSEMIRAHENKMHLRR